MKYTPFVFVLACVTAPAYASPWVEADDVYLRSHIQLLADAGVLKSPVNSYPLPWALIADDIKKTKPTQLAPYLKTAYYALRFQLQRAEGKRVQASIKVMAKNSVPPTAFGQTERAQWGAFAQVEYVEDSFALRASTAVANMLGGKVKFIDDGSYFAINYGAFSLNIGRLERWWGTAWQSTLSVGQNSRPMPAIALTYADVNVPLIKRVFAESFVAIVDGNSAYQYQWANRVSIKPLAWLETAINYSFHWDLREEWQARIDTKDKQRHQVGMDARISLPSVGVFQPGVYAQWQKDSVAALKDSFMLGMDLSGDIANQQVRFVLEYKNSKQGNQKWLQWLSGLAQAGNESMLMGTRVSVGAYVQLDNDALLDLFVHHEQMDTDAVRVQFNYQIPVLKGRLKLSLGYSKAAWEKDHVQGGVSWEYRF